MQIDVGPRRSGKTTQMLRWAAQDPERRVVVCTSASWADVLYRQAKTTMPAVAWRQENFVSGSSGDTSRLRGLRDVEIWVDQADLLIQRMYLGHKVVGAGWTEDKEHPLYHTPVVEPPEPTQQEKDLARISQMLAGGMDEHAGRMLMEHVLGGGKL